MKNFRWVVAGILFICLAVTAGVSFADENRFNAIFFKPALGRNPYLMLNSTQTLHKFQFDFGAVGSYAYHPLEVRQGGSRVQGTIDHLLVTDVVTAFGILEWLQFGIDFPLIFVNRFKDPLTITAGATQNHFDIGDLRFELKARVLSTCCSPVGLAFIPFITAPTGKDSHYVGDPGITGGLKIALDGRVHKRVLLTLNAGYKTGKKINVNSIEYQNVLQLAGGVDLILPHKIDLFAEIDAEAAFNKFFNDSDVNPAEVMIGARWDVKDTGISLQAGGGTCLTCGAKGSRVLGVLSAKYRFNSGKYKAKDSEDIERCNKYFTKQAPPPEIINDEIQTINPVYFDFGSAKLKPEVLGDIDHVIEVINKNDWIKEVKVAGFADSIGTAKANRKISLARTQAVVNYMKLHGLRDGVSLSAVAYGARDPAASNSTASGRALNRRVVFMIANQQQ